MKKQNEKLQICGKTISNNISDHPPFKGTFLIKKNITS